MILDILKEILKYNIPLSLKDKHSQNIKCDISILTIQEEGKKLLKYSLLNKYFKNYLHKLLEDYKTIYFIFKKYLAYDKDYKYFENHNFNPHLLDILSTNHRLPFSKSTFHVFNKELENDIKTLILLNPQSIHCDWAELRCRDNITPLYLACSNPTIPLSIVELLLKYGADKNKPIVLNNKKISIIKDLEKNDNKRLDKIKELFDKY